LGYEKVWLGGTLSDRVGDNKSEVCERLSELLSTVNESYCKIDSPFYNCYKDDIVKWFVSIHPACRLDLVKETFSCFNPLSEMAVRPVWVQGLQGEYETYECGKCTACFRKNAVLHSGDIFVGFDDVNIVNHYEEQFGKPIVATPRTIGTMAYIMEWWEKKDAAREETGL
jgi:7-cyano-7-deazaguanine synthase in queuosine biosynthesis